MKSRPVPAPAPTLAAVSRPATPADSWLDRFLAWRDRVYASPAFHYWAFRLPILRQVARYRTQALFDITAGFVYTQTLVTCVRLDLFRRLAAAPRTPAQLAHELGMPLDGVERLLAAATALRLVSPRSGGRVGLGPLGSPVLAQDSMVRMVNHNALLYLDIADPVALLGRASGAASSVQQFFPYSEVASPQSLPADTVAPYSALMSDTVAPIATEVIDASLLEGRRCLLDVGGGEGGFLRAVAARYPALHLRLFDLPAVVERAAGRMREAGMLDRFMCTSGDFHRDPLPEGADTISLVRILLDHDDARALSLLRRVRAALPPGGLLIIAEPMVGVAGARRVAEVYFSFYLRAMGRGRCRRVDEYTSLLREAGFRRTRVVPTNCPIFTSIVTADA